MAALTYLASAVLMGIAVVAVAIAINRSEPWRRGGTSLPFERTSTLESLLNSPAVWALAFIVAALGVGAAAVLAVGGGLIGGATSDLSGIGIAIVGVVAALLIAFYIGYGSYKSAKARGLIKSQAVFVGAVMVGFLAVVAVAVKLLLAG